MRSVQILFAATLMLYAATALDARQEKVLICHVGNEEGPSGEVYDPACVPEAANGYFCADAGKIDLIVVAKRAKHLDNPSHWYDGISDYEPGDVGASGDGTEDNDGDGVDDGCEPPEVCPCWGEIDLLAVTVENQNTFSCSTASTWPTMALIQNDLIFPVVEGGFTAGIFESIGACGTRDFPPFAMSITAEEADVCIAQIAARCAAIGDPITNGN